MDPRTRALIFGVLALITIAAIIGTIIYAVRLPKNQRITRLPGATQLPVISVAPTSSDSTPATGDTKTFTGQGFVVKYPGNWGILTCSNTPHFEFDPTNSQDVKGVVCDEAVKPVTVLVESNLDCPGTKVQIGSYSVTKAVAGRSDGGTNYRWCVPVGGKVLDITERVSPTGARATSLTDYSDQVEEIIKNISASPAGS